MDTDTRCTTLYDTLEDGICFVDADERITTWNRAAEKITGYPAEEVVGGCSPERILSPLDLKGRPLGPYLSSMSLVLRDGGCRIAETMIRHKSGLRIAVLAKLLPVYGEGGTVAGAGIIFTPRTRIDDGRLVDTPSSIVTRDALTGLPNRAALENHLKYKINEYRGTGALFCALCMNIDHLEKVNSTHGLDVGDKVLTDIAARLKCNLRRTDFIGRWDSRVFLGIFTIRSNHGAYVLGQRVRDLVAGCNIWSAGRCIRVTASVGVAVIRWNDSQESIVGRACRFLYASKDRGQDCVSVEDMENEDTVLANV